MTPLPQKQGADQQRRCQDFSFPHDAIAAEATPGIETTLIADLDLDLIKELRAKGSVRNMESRRTDLYDLNWNDQAMKEGDEPV